MTGAIKTLGEAAPQEFQGYGAVIKSATPTALRSGYVCHKAKLLQKYVVKHENLLQSFLSYNLDKCLREESQGFFVTSQAVVEITAVSG